MAGEYKFQHMPINIIKGKTESKVKTEEKKEAKKEVKKEIKKEVKKEVKETKENLITIEDSPADEIEEYTETETEIEDNITLETPAEETATHELKSSTPDAEVTLTEDSVESVEESLDEKTEEEVIEIDLTQNKTKMKSNPKFQMPQMPMHMAMPPFFVVDDIQELLSSGVTQDLLHNLGMPLNVKIEFPPKQEKQAQVSFGLDELDESDGESDTSSVEETFEDIEMEGQDISMQKSQAAAKHLINVGGKPISVKAELLGGFNIDVSKLNRITYNGKQSFFLDRDPIYFEQICDLIKQYKSFDKEKFIDNLDEYSPNLVNELCSYKIIPDKYKPEPKIKMPKSVTFSHAKHDDLVKIAIAGEDNYFETGYHTLCKSRYFEKQLQLKRQSKQSNRIYNFTLTKVNPVNFRYILNFMRNGEMFVYTKEIVEMLTKYEIEHTVVEQAQPKQVTSFEKPTNSSHLLNQLAHSNIDSMMGLNMITTDSKLGFGQDLIFDLKQNCTSGTITDLVLVVDLPVLKANDGAYADLLPYRVIDNVNIINTSSANKKQLLLYANSQSLYLEPFLSSSQTNPKLFRNLGDPLERKKLIYRDKATGTEHLIELHRLFIPLCFKSEISLDQLNPFMLLKIAPMNQIIKSRVPITLLNVYLMAQIRHTATKSLILNAQLSFDKIHYINLPIRAPESTHSKNYSIASMPLTKIGTIKEFYFTINDKSNRDPYGPYSDSLIDVSIVTQVTLRQGMTSWQPILRLDPFMISSYMPLKQFGHELPKGMYHYRFSTGDTSSGLSGLSNQLVIKTKYIEGVVNLFIVEQLTIPTQ